MADSQEKKEKKIGVEIHSPTVLHGKRVRLIRGKNEVVGTLLSQDHQKNSSNFVFQYVDASGVKKFSQVTADELKDIEEALLDY